jgi:hypothetical protein
MRGRHAGRRHLTPYPLLESRVPPPFAELRANWHANASVPANCVPRSIDGDQGPLGLPRKDMPLQIGKDSANHEGDVHDPLDTDH